MKSPGYKVKIGIVGCGAIGSRMAEAIRKDFKNDCRLIGLYDINRYKVERLIKKLAINISANQSLESIINKSDCMIEAVNSDQAKNIVKKTLKAKKSILAMSVGRILNSKGLFELARKNKCYILLPSGAIAGIDAVKAASLKRINKITLTTRKPPAGLMNNEHLKRRGIDLSKIKKETVLFNGPVEKAVKYFPQNINVAATIALASQAKRRKSPFLVRLITSPKYTRNIHEIEMEGDFGHMVSRTENVPCPDNPKTSYLAVLSGLQTLKQYCTGILVGT
jgi:aspartate dehydrogenase